MVPAWIQIVSALFLLLGLVCAVVIALDEMRDQQHMWIMNVVWPVTALFGTLLIVWAYFSVGKLATKRRMMQARENGEEMPTAAFMSGT